MREFGERALPRDRSLRHGPDIAVYIAFAPAGATARGAVTYHRATRPSRGLLSALVPGAETCGAIGCGMIGLT